MNHEDCMGDEVVQKDRSYSFSVCYANTIIVTFLFLISNAEENTMKFGLSWHVYFMMEFMDPSRGAPAVKLLGLGEYSAVFVTTLIGALVAILSSLFPMPLLGIRNLAKDAEALTNETDDVLSHSIEYFCRQYPTARLFEIEEKIDILQRTVGQAQGSLDSSWWETLDVCHFASVRQLFTEFHLKVLDLSQIMYSIKKAMADEDFEGGHNSFC
eukprot:CAMPEP_0180705378 /NCGR_PEP_ID=MMETSP1038_2-20121128/7647_1 /TAXON_ID=632150 /ORGANISM="Azadinium spinosum, Strain 3D9" /LENGTH=212 /DNA_ID=CAMNT_0022737253 /DNA_START=192 /DNA_END=827 /DNA_ORIENTATION=-